jgi:hypothetical protein
VQFYSFVLGATGSGTGADWTNAFPSIPTLVRGNTYYFADGTFTNRTFNNAVSGTQTISLIKATVANHGTSVGWQNSYGDGKTTFIGSMRFNTGYYVFDGFELIGETAERILTVVATNTVIRNCILNGNFSRGPDNRHQTGNLCL